MKIIWTNLALEDLRSIYDYIAKDSSFYADRFVARLINRVEQIERHPRSGRKVPEIGSEDVRELIEGNYRIIFRINADHIGIVRIHHSARLLKDI